LELINYALRGIPPERVRFHCCYGINKGPRVHDEPLRDYVELTFQINAGAYSFESANPRHAWSWHVFEEVKLPEGTILIPGVHQPRPQHRRASGVHRRPAGQLRSAGRPRARHRRGRLRLFVPGDLNARGPCIGGVGEVAGAGRGGAPGEHAAVAPLRAFWNAPVQAQRTGEVQYLDQA
jgi:hypothetical protein